MRHAHDFAHAGVVGSHVGVAQNRDGARHLSGWTVAALICVVLPERLLNRMEFTVSLQPFDRGDVIAFVPDRH